ncbi:hypothetical protein [Streptomyces sp. MST-110588]|uniref:hypothetical protein n=1 Tax=Streptomyces sp. MST-110588 TaxID=2833628 RepID=UPI001F5C8A48|nr:hypothetical protein [Streptomyces sp. MST-110588]UNO39362.1 hypothetical protein KGS77_06695 [Streptomyces sp. MST-110588]
MPVSTTPGVNWGTWINLEGGIFAEPAPVLNADNRVQVFVQGGSNGLYSKWEKRDGSWNSSYLKHEGANIAGVPSAVLGRDGKIRVYYRTPDNHLEVITQSVVNGGFDTPKRIVTNIGGDPAAAFNADGRIQVFFRGSDGALWYTRNQGLQYEQYTGPASLGGTIHATPSPVLDGSGRIVVAVKGGNDTLHTIQQKVASDPDAWESFQQETTGVTTRPTVVADAAGRVQIFYRGSDGSAWRVGQQDDYDRFHTSVSLRGQIINRPTAALGLDGRVNVIVKGSDKALWVAVQNQENDSAYGHFQSLAGVIGDADVSPVIANRDGLLYVFTQGSGAPRNLWLQRQTWA